MSYYYRISVTRPFSEVEQVLREALKKRGFGVITEVDVQKTMEEKLGIGTDRYKILGACNPRLAHSALAREPDIGVLLPCNIVLRSDGGATIVSMILPTAQLGRTGNAALQPLAVQAEEALKAAVDEIKEMRASEA